tara:strand:- start:55 stop:495 length:441 start_codon:yes stop_codon:yes gene_type:complete
MEGKIYKLTSPHTDKIYIGSTTQKYLCSRMSNHKIKYDKGIRQYSSYEIFEYGDVSIHLIETCKCKNRTELRIREQYHIDRNNCVNIKKTYLTEKEKKEYIYTYHTKNRVKMRDRHNTLYAYKTSWGGDLRSWNNNLLNIDPTLFE